MISNILYMWQGNHTTQILIPFNIWDELERLLRTHQLSSVTKPKTYLHEVCNQMSSKASTFQLKAIIKPKGEPTKHLLQLKYATKIQIYIF